MIVCLDAFRIPDHQVRLARRGLKNLSKAVADDDDARELSMIAQAAISQREPFYNLRLVMLLRDAQADRLVERAERLCQRYEAQIGLSLMNGQQLGALDFFTGRAQPRLSGPSAHHTVFGSALPVAMGGVAGLVNRPRPRGIYTGFRIGLGSQNLGPVYFDPFVGDDGQPRNQAYHIGFSARRLWQDRFDAGMLARMRAHAGLLPWRPWALASCPRYSSTIPGGASPGRAATCRSIRWSALARMTPSRTSTLLG
jgi:hypothetical protein